MYHMEHVQVGFEVDLGCGCSEPIVVWAFHIRYQQYQ
jgi:hypothetical protein